MGDETKAVVLHRDIEGLGPAGAVAVISRASALSLNATDGCGFAHAELVERARAFGELIERPDF